MIKKKTVKSRNTCKVTFELGNDVDAETVQLLADFTDWRAVPFKKLKSGKWQLVQELPPGQTYEFRYRVVEGGRDYYLNDPEADRIVPNGVGTENAVIRVDQVTG